MSAEHYYCKYEKNAVQNSTAELSASVEGTSLHLPKTTKHNIHAV